MLLTTLTLTLLATDLKKPTAGELTSPSTPATTSASPAPTPAPVPEARAASSRSQAVGAVETPAALPGGSTALYAFIGAPELGLGFRQGFDLAELEARVTFDWVQLAGVAEIGGRMAVFKSGGLVLAPGVFLGLKVDSGARYFDVANFAYLGLRPRLDFSMSYQVAETVQLLSKVEIPWAIATNVIGTQFTPTLAVGAEFHVGGPFSLLASALGGVDVTKEPLGVPQVRPAWGLRLGLGYRMF
jgi:hypothetical protein